MPVPINHFISIWNSWAIKKKKDFLFFFHFSASLIGQTLVCSVLLGAFAVTLLLSCSANENFNITHTQPHGHTVKSCDYTYTLTDTHVEHHSRARLTHISANKHKCGWGFISKYCTCHLLSWAVSNMDANGWGQQWSRAVVIILLSGVHATTRTAHLAAISHLCISVLFNLVSVFISYFSSFSFGLSLFHICWHVHVQLDVIVRII